jgi:hypothetical protein
MIDQQIRVGGSEPYRLRGKEILLRDSLNNVKLMQLIDSNGFPDESMIGLPSNIRGCPKYYIILRHRYQNKNFDLSEILYRAVTNGELLPEIFAELEDKKWSTLFRKPKYLSTLYYVVEGKWKEIPHTKSFIREINTNRDKIGLDDIETFRRKVKYETKNRLFIFFRHEAIVDLNGISEQQWDAGNNKLKK